MWPFSGVLPLMDAIGAAILEQKATLLAFVSPITVSRSMHIQ